ncbi:MAG: tetratricopeptide repeat protein [Spirochaetaceae bacterium]|jgi:tetratricopeptide (TPR) repeat protein|nr:tetratricopeptide repeat protein [Spirochaetaceae bacterium]
MDIKRRKIPIRGLLIFFSFIVTIAISLLIYQTLRTQYEKLNSDFVQFIEDNRKQADEIYNQVQSLISSVDDFKGIYNSTSDLHFEKLIDLNKITNWTIRETGTKINESFLEFVKARNREIDLESVPGKDSLEYEVVLEKAFNEGFLLYKENRFAQARDLFFDALSLYPYDKEIRFYYLSSLYYSEPENLSNYQYLKDQLRLFTYDKLYSEKSLNILAVISLNEGDRESAYKFYRTLYENNETNRDYLRSLGMIEFQLGKFEKSSQSFRSYLPSSPKDYEVLYFYGLALFNLKLYEEALKQFYLVKESDESYGNLNRKIDETIEKMENS